MKLFLDPMKEEQWINSILRQGYRLDKKSALCYYTFTETNDAYIVRTDYQDYLTVKDYTEYKLIHHDLGWDLIRGNRIEGLHIWEKLIDGNDELNSDDQSKLSYFKRMMNYTSAMIFIFLFILVFNYPKLNELFLTPGLWEMKGSLFWKAFLFELPFVLLRQSFFIVIAIDAYVFFRSYNRYKKFKDEIVNNS
ncbi:DUF2812 domain-containing protein [Macrococcus lamae]|nr:DUF2812 domain-containing protein [Macrococcus lamae]